MFYMQKQSSKVPEKSFAVGTVAETLQAMGAATSSFVGPLIPVVMATVCDEDDEVRSNAVFCLGILASNGGAPVLQYLFIVDVDISLFILSIVLLKQAIAG